MIERDCRAEMRRLPAFEESAEIPEQNADTLRFHALWLQARARHFEDDGKNMITVSTRFARVLAKALLEGADAKEANRG